MFRCIKFSEVLRRHCLIILSTVSLICLHLTSVRNGGCNYYVIIDSCGGNRLKVKGSLFEWNVSQKYIIDIQIVLIFHASWKHQHNCRSAEFFHRSLSCVSNLKFGSTVLHCCGHVNKITATLKRKIYAHQLFLVTSSIVFYQDPYKLGPYNIII